MKTFLIASIALISALLYSQDNMVAAADDKETGTYTPDEIVLNKHGDVLLGELDARSKKGRALDANSKIAYYFENASVEYQGQLKTLYFKVQKVKYKSEAHIRLYTRKDYVQKTYPPGSDMGNSFNSFIPGDMIPTDDIVVVLQPGQKGTIEVDLSGYGIVMPSDGLFVSLESVVYFDEKGNKATGLKPRDKTWVDFHPTTTDNFCAWINPQGTDSWFWVNSNKLIKNDFKTVFKKEPTKKILTAPNFGLKISQG